MTVEQILNNAKCFKGNATDFVEKYKNDISKNKYSQDFIIRKLAKTFGMNINSLRLMFEVS